MIDIKLKPCCMNCDCSDISADSLRANGLGTVTTIKCEHSLVCKEYREDKRQVFGNLSDYVPKKDFNAF